MNRTVWRSIAILSLWFCLSAPATARAVETQPAGTPVEIDINDLFRHWVQSSEEQQPGGTVQIFRPAASRKFPPSRFRMAYKFARNGDCEFYFLSPDDAHHFKPCKWKSSARDETILQISANGSTASYRIVELSAEILRLTPLDPQQSR